MIAFSVRISRVIIVLIGICHVGMIPQRLFLSYFAHFLTVSNFDFCTFDLISHCHSEWPFGATF